MSFIKSLFKIKNQYSAGTNPMMSIPKKVEKTTEKNITFIKNMFSHTEDLIFKELDNGSTKVVMVFLETMIDKEKIEKLITNHAHLQLDNSDLKAYYQRHSITFTDLQTVEQKLIYGFCLVFIEGLQEIYAIETSISKDRTIAEPENEKIILGAHDGFIENLSTNLNLLRKRLKSSKLQINYFPFGNMVETKIAMVYFNNLTNKAIITECEKRLKKICIDIGIPNGFLEELIEDSTISPFPQILITERVDRVIGHLNEGKIVLLTDGSPTALILPVTFSAFYQSPDDYNSRWLIGTFIRTIRYVCFFISILLPSYYISVIGFHFEVLPDELIGPVGSSIHEIPFPPLIEALFMELTIELIREAGIRLPTRVGQTIGIVGGLVIGDAIVQAGLISTTMIVIVALTAIASYCVPSHGMSDAVRLLRFPFMILAASFGFVGISFCFIMLLAHLCKLESFGTPYFAPFAPFRFKDLKDTFVRLPIGNLRTRPLDSRPLDHTQMKGTKGWKNND